MTESFDDGEFLRTLEIESLEEKSHLFWYNIEFEDDHHKGNTSILAKSSLDAIARFKVQHAALDRPLRFKVRQITYG